MNITIANRLYELRKKNGFSQEELADKLGISRQSVSKWERAEASPDTDNLILLAELYGVTLDELLRGESTASGSSAASGAAPEEAAAEPDADAEGTKVNIEPGGIHVHDGKDNVHISWKGIQFDDGKEKGFVGWKGIHVTGSDGCCADGEAADGVKVDVDAEGGKRARVVVNGNVVVDDDYNYKDLWHVLPVPLMCLVAFLLLGILLSAWKWAWLVFLIIPIYYSLVDAIKKRNASHFAYPVLLTALYLMAGIVFGRWHPEWVMFLTIPAYYAITNACHEARKRKKVIDIDAEVPEDDE